eukprot:scaffold49118_cov48-Phaeocystis_antarctica.AAC.2
MLYTPTVVLAALDARRLVFSPRKRMRGCVAPRLSKPPCVLGHSCSLAWLGLGLGLGLGFPSLRACSATPAAWPAGRGSDPS